MKKIFYSLFPLLAASILPAQTWSQDFSSCMPPALPAGWMQNNVDGLTVPAALSSYSFGVNAWVSADFSATDPAHGRAAVSTSFYNPSGTANDWLITPQLNVPANAVLDWEGSIFDPNFPDGYEVRISTTGTNVADFSTVLFTVAAENLSWTSRGLSLGGYSGQNVYLAFVNTSNDDYLLLIDNIKVSVPVSANDGSMVNITGLTRYGSGPGNQAISGTFKSMGYASASSMVINFSVNNGPATTQTVNFPGPLSYGQSFNYSFTNPAFMQLGTNHVKAWVSYINGVAEVNHANDTASSFVYRSSTTRPRQALIEEFSSSSCEPCSTVNPPFDSLLKANNANTGGNVNVVKYQVNWPAPPVDPSNNRDVDVRVNHYRIFDAPTTLANGNTEMYFHNQSEINAAVAAPAYADITASLNVTGTLAQASATITPYITIASQSPLRVHQVLAQHYYNYPGAFTTQKDYYNVMRKMFPDASGSLTTANDSSAFTVSFSHNITTAVTPLQMSYDFWVTSYTVPVIYEYVVFVQDSVSNDVLQCASASFTVSANATGLPVLEKYQQIAVYPNPAQDFVTVAVDMINIGGTTLSIVDMNGNTVYSKKAEVPTGKSEIRINTSCFAAGTYAILWNNGSTVFSEKLVISR